MRWRGRGRKVERKDGKIKEEEVKKTEDRMDEEFKGRKIQMDWRELGR